MAKLDKIRQSIDHLAGLVIAAEGAIARQDVAKAFEAIATAAGETARLAAARAAKIRMPWRALSAVAGLRRIEEEPLAYPTARAVAKTAAAARGGDDAAAVKLIHWYRFLPSADSADQTDVLRAVTKQMMAMRDEKE